MNDQEPFILNRKKATKMEHVYYPKCTFLIHTEYALPLRT